MDEAIPVIVGVGQVEDRPGDPFAGLDSVGLMVAALKAADQHAGGGWLADVDSLAVVSQLSFPELNPATARVAEGIGAVPAHSFQTATPSGDSPILLLNEAANRIARGESLVCAVTGGEALRTAAGRAAAQAKEHDALRNATHRRIVGYGPSYGLVIPIEIYPLIENAYRAHVGQTLAEAQRESGEIWAGMSEVAARTPSAWLHEPRTAEEIVAAGPGNRPIAFPYTKLQVANSSVNQGAGFLVTSLAEARRRGVPEDRLIYVGMGAAAHAPMNILKRDKYYASSSMSAAITHALSFNRLTVDDLDHVELYSCFPCVPKMARRVLGWPEERDITVFGGLTFGGGPIGNYMAHPLACMVDKLRSGGGTGFLYANGGYATHHHAIAISAEPLPAARFPQDFDVQAQADEARGPVPPIDEEYRGAATIETYTVFYNRDGSPKNGVIVALTPEGTRTLANVPGDDSEMIDFLTDGGVEPVGTSGPIVDGADELARWRA
ncbi:acetyl-CoA acetyltransferase [Tsuneonella mangrovi]|uniref:acetyl-CoA acetyltransferase n=1 Tax=Tsuneonella mangrovi TaxID=1982042 RepID=UPI000BA23F3A|nr:acetyl-CoA acetyltransferase [Tsuneonella mangrovi]